MRCRQHRTGATSEAKRHGCGVWSGGEPNGGRSHCCHSLICALPSLCPLPQCSPLEMGVPRPLSLRFGEDWVCSYVQHTTWSGGEMYIVQILVVIILVYLDQGCTSCSSGSPHASRSPLEARATLDFPPSRLEENSPGEEHWTLKRLWDKGSLDSNARANRAVPCPL